MLNEENVTNIVAEKTVRRNSSKYILNDLENSEEKQQEKLDKIAETFKPGLTGLIQALADIFKQKNRTQGLSNEEPLPKRIRPQTCTDTRANSKCIIEEEHGAARANAWSSNRYVATSDDDETPDDSISIPDQDYLDTDAVSCLLSEISQIK